MGATWFVSYAYYEKIDRTHRNWDRVATTHLLISKYNKGRSYHKDWLEEVLSMSIAKLNKNTIGLDTYQIKTMATKLLENCK